MSSGVAKTHYWENLIELAIKGTNLTAPTTLYIGLFTVTPGESGGGTEVTGGAYARQLFTFGAVAAQSSGSQVANSAQITFPVATAGWGTVVAVGIFDAVTSGNMLYYGALGSSVAVNTNNQFIIASGALTLLED